MFKTIPTETRKGRLARRVKLLRRLNVARANNDALKVAALSQSIERETENGRARMLALRRR